jgi:hypothetical protein
LTSDLQGWHLSHAEVPNLPDIFQWGNFQRTVISGITTITIPYWFITPLVAVAAFLPWIKRFSLRTMLIATTVAAIALGAIVALSR